MAPTTSTSRSNSNCIVYRFRMSGGVEQARAMSRVSARPSSVRSRLGLAGFLRDGLGFQTLLDEPPADPGNGVGAEHPGGD